MYSVGAKTDLLTLFSLELVFTGSTEILTLTSLTSPRH